RGRIPVILDGGIRRGTDIFKSLALGAAATGVGRPYIWGLASFGQEGVETVLALLRKEFEMTMRQMGTTSVKRISKDYLSPHTAYFVFASQITCRIPATPFPAAAFFNLRPVVRFSPRPA